MLVDVKEYQDEPVNGSFSAFRAVKTYVDDTNPVHIDSERLERVSGSLYKGDSMYYFYMLGRMVKNNIPVYANHGEMRDHFGVKYRVTVSISVERLIRAGLIFKVEGRRTAYLINPVYAWKGNRLDYLDKSSFEDCTGK